MSVSKVEMFVQKTTDAATWGLLINNGSPVVAKVIEKAGQACQDHPVIVVAGTIGAIAAKDLAPRVIPYLEPVAHPVINIAQKYPRALAITSSTMCSSLLPFAVTGEPLTVAATWVTCSVTAVSLAAYLLKDDSKRTQD